MSEFTLDTWGEVRLPWKNADGRKMPTTLWSDLDAFTQGYVEAAMLAIQWPDPSEGYGPSSSVIRFDWLASEALAMILADCAAANDTFAKWTDQSAAGGSFWRIRQRGDIPAFPPVTISLGDDGKVYLRASDLSDQGRPVPPHGSGP